MPGPRMGVHTIVDRELVHDSPSKQTYPPVRWARSSQEGALGEARLPAGRVQGLSHAVAAAVGSAPAAVSEALDERR